jgi:YbbR domain-containing protein
MKTLKELNSKWYWRLIKVSYVLFAFMLFFIFCISISESIKIYDPKTITEIKTKYEGWITKIRQLEVDYPGEVITRSEIDKKAKNPKAIIRALFALEKNIE